MKIDILTLFPSMFNGFLEESIIKRAIANNLIKINIINFRDYSPLNNRQVDDTPYGGGGGMVLRCEPIFNAVNSLKQADTKVILLTPDGTKFKQRIAQQLSEYNHLIIICGHYEGFDERIRALVDMELSIGDYILTGGEIPAMIITDTVVRLIDGVIKDVSKANESFNNNLLDYPTYTNPAQFEGMSVPDVLLSGNHEQIAKWRREQQIIKTKTKRPDLIQK